MLPICIFSPIQIPLSEAAEKVIHRYRWECHGVAHVVFDLKVWSKLVPLLLVMMVAKDLPIKSQCTQHHVHIMFHSLYVCIMCLLQLYQVEFLQVPH